MVKNYVLGCSLFVMAITMFSATIVVYILEQKIARLEKRLDQKWAFYCSEVDRSVSRCVDKVHDISEQNIALHEGVVDVIKITTSNCEKIIDEQTLMENHFRVLSKDISYIDNTVQSMTSSVASAVRECWGLTAKMDNAIVTLSKMGANHEIDDCENVITCHMDKIMEVVNDVREEV